MVLAATSLLLLLAAVSVWVSSRKSVPKPVQSTPRSPTPQEKRQQGMNQQTEFLKSLPKPSHLGFEVLKFLARNPRDASLDAQGVASLFCAGSIASAQEVIFELRAAGYIERSGPAMPGEGNNHYRISQRGIVCVDTYAA